MNEPVLGAPEGSVQLPPGRAVAPRVGSKEVLPEELQTLKGALTPALGCALTFTVTVAADAMHGACAAIV